jgi:hypothetical protein
MARRRRLEQECARGTSRKEGSWAGKGAARFSFVRRGFGVIDCDGLYWDVALKVWTILGTTEFGNSRYCWKDSEHGHEKIADIPYYSTRVVTRVDRTWLYTNIATAL